MELKATSLGKHLAQHPYDRVKLLPAGVEVAGERHEYLIPFNKLIAINCKRGLVWGELEFVLFDEKVVRLHGTEWAETQYFFRELNRVWNNWSEEMSRVAAAVLTKQYAEIERKVKKEHWLKRSDLLELQTNIHSTIEALPVPLSRLDEFANCQKLWTVCKGWLEQGEKYRHERNSIYTNQMLETHAEFFRQIESSPLNLSQARAVINGEDAVLVLAGAGSGKTSVLVARAGWLLQQGEAREDQILLLAFGRQAALEMDERIAARLQTKEIQTRTFHSLARYIIQQSSKKVPNISVLESDKTARHNLLISTWQQQCREKKAMAKGWRQYLSEDLNWDLSDGEYWQDPYLINRLASRLEQWLGIIRMQGGSQQEMIDGVPEDVREHFTKRIKLMSPLLKSWKSALKAEGAVDFAGLIHQAIHLLDQYRFISPWKHILVDEFQDISPQRAALLNALRRQNSQTCFYAVGDDWQAIYRFSGAELALTTSFNQYFGAGEQCALDTTYRFNQRIGDIANRFVQQNPQQLAKPLNSLSKGDKKAVTLLADDQFDALLDKLSGYVLAEQRILVLARYHHLKPDSLEKAATRWPKLKIDFMTMHASKGQEADYVIILGLQAGKDGFPARARESIIEQALLPIPEEFPDAEERRLLYVALTRARHRIWLLYNKKSPSTFVDILKHLGVATVSRP